MRATTNTIHGRSLRLRHCFLAAMAACALALAVTAGPADAYRSLNSVTGGAATSGASDDSGGSGYSSVSAISGAPASDPRLASGSPNGGSGYSSVNAITAAPPSEPRLASGSPSGGSGQSTVNAITGASASEPRLASGSPSGGGFDWASAAIGAGGVLAFVALFGAALLSVRRRTGATPSVSTG